MKQHMKCVATVLAGLAIAAPAKAQTVTTLSDFHNFHLSATYGNWDADGSQIIFGGSGYTPTLTSGATSFEVNAQGYGSGAYDFATPISAPGATQWQLTFTINQTMAHPDSTGLWFGPNVDISDGTHQVALNASSPGLAGARSYGPYVGPGTYTIYGGLGDLDTTTITAFNLEIDPAEYGGSAPYDVTYQSFVLLTPVPEPATLSVFGIGCVGLLLARRRAGSR
jgi:hypothetical protein